MLNIQGMFPLVNFVIAVIGKHSPDEVLNIADRFEALRLYFVNSDRLEHAVPNNPNTEQ